MLTDNFNILIYCHMNIIVYLCDNQVNYLLVS